MVSPILKYVFTLGFLFTCLVCIAQRTDEKIDSLATAIFSIDKSKMDSIVETGTAILQQIETKDQEARLLGLLAVAYFEKGDLKTSTDLLFRAKNIAETTNNHELTAKVYGSIAHQYVQLNLNDKAKYYLTKAISEIDKLPDENDKQLLKGLSYIELGNIDFEDKKYSSANKNYKESLQHFQKIKNPNPQTNYHYRRSLYNIGNSYVYINQAKVGEKYLNKALRVQANGNKSLQPFIYNSLAQVYYNNGAYQRAVDSLAVILKDPDFDNPKLTAEIYLKLSQNYKELGDNDAYFLYNEKYIKLNDSIQENEFKAIDSAIDTEQKEYAAALSDADKNTRSLLIGGLFFLITFLLVIGFLLLKRKKEKIIFEKVTRSLKEKLNTSHLKPESPHARGDDIPLPNPAEKALLSKLETFENSVTFTNPKMNISDLAVQLDTNTTYLSTTINTYKGKNFNTYINELRIAYICEKIYTKPQYLKYKISYLAKESGFASHSAFATVFKNVTGISPSVFLREAAKNNHQPAKAQPTNIQ